MYLLYLYLVQVLIFLLLNLFFLFRFLINNMIHLLNHFFFDKELNNFDILFQDFLNFENFLILINFALMIEIYHLNL